MRLSGFFFFDDVVLDEGVLDTLFTLGVGGVASGPLVAGIPGGLEGKPAGKLGAAVGDGVSCCVAFAAGGSASMCAVNVITSELLAVDAAELIVSCGGSGSLLFSFGFV